MKKQNEHCRPAHRIKRRQYSENDLINKIIKTMITAWIPSTSHDNVAEVHGQIRKGRKKKATLCREQSFSFKPLIIGHIPVGQSKDVLNKHIQVSKAIFDSLIGDQNGIL